MKKNKNRKSYKGSRKPNNQDVRNQIQDSKNRGLSDDGNKYKLSSLNDVEWYTRYPELTYSTASIPYPIRPGMYVPTNDISWSEGIHSAAVPGVLSLCWAPSFGYSEKASDPASIVAREMYGRIRKAYSSSLSVGAPDIVMYLGALDSVFAYIAALKRVYRTVVAFSPDNYLLPNGLLKAYGFKGSEVSQLLSNRTRLYSVVNELIYMSRKFTCPAGMDIMNRHYWLGDNVYTDAPSINSQMYVFMPSSLYKFKLFADSEGVYSSGLELSQLPWMGSSEDPTIVETIFNYGRELLDALAAWEDAYTINGYLSRAYEGTPNFVIDILSSDDQLVPVYVPEVLVQIENSRAIHGGPSTYSGNVTQDVPNNAILCDPTFQVVGDPTIDPWNVVYGTMRPVVNVSSVNPTVGDTLIATRLKWALRSANPTEYGFIRYHVYTGTEIVLEYRLIINDEISVPQSSAVSFEQQYIYDGQSTFTQLDRSLYTMSFDHHPQYWMMFSNEAYGTLTRFFPLFNVMNITSMDNTTLGLMHRVCIYSELNAFSM